MHKCICMLVCIVFFVATLHRCTQTKPLYVMTRAQDEEDWETVQELHQEPFDIATLSAHKFSCCVVVICLSSSTVFSCCAACFHVLCCGVLFCVQAKPKVALPEGSISKRYKVGFTCTCCYPGKELAKTGKVYKQFQQQ